MLDEAIPVFNIFVPVRPWGFSFVLFKVVWMLIEHWKDLMLEEFLPSLTKNLSEAKLSTSMEIE